MGPELELLKYAVAAGGGSGFAIWMAVLSFRSLLAAQGKQLELQKEHLDSLQRQLDFANASHSKHLAKEAEIVQALGSLKDAVEGLADQVERISATGAKEKSR